MVSGRATLCHLNESLAAQAMTNLAERGLLGVLEHESTLSNWAFRMRFFGHQIFVFGPEALGLPSP